MSDKLITADFPSNKPSKFVTTNPQLQRTVVRWRSGRQQRLTADKQSGAIIDKYQHMHFFTFNTVLV